MQYIFTYVVGGGTLKLATALSAINGAVVVSEKSTLDLGSSWVSNAESISISSGSKIKTSTDILLSDSSKMIFSIASETDFASIICSSLSSTGTSFGSLFFDINETAFADKDTISIALASLINGGTVDWSKFDISAGNYLVSLDSTNISFSVPEPSAYAAIFALLALGFVAWRKHK